MKSTPGRVVCAQREPVLPRRPSQRIVAPVSEHLASIPSVASIASVAIIGGGPAGAALGARLAAAGRRVAWMVDRLGGMPEIVVRRLPDLLRPWHGVSGVALGTGGEIRLVVDAAALIAEMGKLMEPAQPAEVEVPYLAAPNYLVSKAS